MEPLGLTCKGRQPLLRFFLLLLGVWLLAWLPIGLLKGDPDYVLTTVSRGSTERQIYQGLLYSGLLLVFLDSWRRHAPSRPSCGSARDFLAYASLGLFSALGLRVVMVVLGGRPMPHLDLAAAILAKSVLSALVVALVEEAVFRGFLLGRLASVMPQRAAVAMSSAIFAAVHLFRPGSMVFRAGLGAGLFLLGLLLARIAWERQSIAASAGLHAGLILPNLLDPWPNLQACWWSGWQQEPVSGALSWTLTLLLWAQWEWWQRRCVKVASEPSGRD